ncbi:MAG: S4 domain-containing protein [candidate division WOR-3 bacterium]|nr:S4 domain-containing protein [candidate division WOR-3 bacterium]
MRLDLFLKNTRIIKRRSAVKELIQKGIITIGGGKPKVSKKVKEGMNIKVGDRSYEILKIPERGIKKDEGEKYYRIIDDRNYSG